MKELESRIQAQIAQDHDLARQAEILRSIPGIGPVLSTALIAQMSELGSCSDKQIAALAGVAPINNDSGRKDGKRSIRGGRYEIRCLLYQAALVASNHNPALKIFAKRLRDKGRPHKVVLIAVARKLLIVANSLVAKNQLWKAA
ncbi:MAG: IS110 family transposase [Alphaproteobacteria bacterium]|nr:IS110 family transposase [Alphaproteobacteria bacterium]